MVGGRRDTYIYIYIYIYIYVNKLRQQHDGITARSK